MHNVRAAKFIILNAKSLVLNSKNSSFLIQKSSFYSLGSPCLSPKSSFSSEES